MFVVLQRRSDNFATGSGTEGNINMHNTIDVDMNSAAVASLLEMGYSRKKVENTVRRYRQLHGEKFFLYY